MARLIYLMVMVDAKTMMVIPQDPNTGGAIPVIRSDGQNAGV